MLELSVPAQFVITVAFGMGWIAVLALVWRVCFAPNAFVALRSPIVRRPANERDRL